MKVFANYRSAIALAGLALAILPAGVLVVSCLFNLSPSIVGELTRSPFLVALKRSLVQVLWSTLVGVGIGWPCGYAMGTTRWLGQRFLVALLLTPLLVPSFLAGIGVSALKPLFAYRHQHFFDGLSGCVQAASGPALCLTILLTAMAVRSLAGSHTEAALLHGGPRLVYRMTRRYVLPIAFGAALLGALYAVADSGVGQIMGYHGVASDILLAFSARQDWTLAAAKALAQILVLLPVVVPLAWMLARWMDGVLLGRDIPKPSATVRFRPGRIAVFLAAIAALWLIAAPVAGLVRPLLGRPIQTETQAALTTLRESWRDSLLAWGAAGACATALGYLIAACSCRQAKLRRAILLVALLLFALPPAISALGLARIATQAPAGMDFLFRSTLTLPLGLAVRCLPVALLIALFAWSRTPWSQVDAAAIFGISRTRFFLNLLFPAHRPAILAAWLVCFLVAAADTGTTLLLKAPGQDTYTSRIFAVMDNGSEALIAAMCVVVLLCGLVVSVLVAVSLGGRKAGHWSAVSGHWAE